VTDVAKLIADMVRAGVDADLIGRAAAAIVESSVPSAPVRTARQERNARYYAAKSAEKRLNASEQDVSDGDEPLPPKEKSPTPPKEITPYPQTPSTPLGVSVPAGFDRFWEIYPNKVGKPIAAKKFAAALRVASFEAIMAGLSAYVAKLDDRPWCNPSTWLHQQRWADQPAEVARGSPGRAPHPRYDPFKALAEELADGQDRSERSDLSDWNDAQGVPVRTIEHHR